MVYCPDARGVGIALAAARRLLGMRVVTQAAVPGALSCATWDPVLARVGLAPAGRLANVLKGMGRRLYGAVDAVICLSSESVSEARDAGIPGDRIVRQPHGVDLDLFRPATGGERRRIRRELGLPATSVIALFLGRLSREKGVLELLDAWRAVNASGALLVMAGPETPGHPLDVGQAAREFVHQHGLASRVRFLAGTPASARVMRAADLFVSPSHYEAFGLTRAEAMACGLPLVVTPTGGVAEHLVDEQNALLCDPERSDQLASALDRLIADASLRRSLGRAARATAEQCFDGAQVAERIAALLETVARKAAGAET